MNIEPALDQTLALVLERGYGNTSHQNIADRLGALRSTLYATFGGRRTLFEQVLRRYIDTGRLPVLNDSAPPRDALLQAFTSAIDNAGGEHDYYQLMSDALDLGRRVPDIADTIKATYEELETQFRAAIERGQAAGEIAGHVDPAGVACVLLGMYLGLGVLIRAGAGPAVLHAVTDQVQTLLPAPA